MEYKTLLFDLDGTIINTNELIINSFLYTLERYYPGKYTREKLIPHFGKTLHEQMILFGDEEKADDMIKVYREHNLQTHDDMVLEYPFVKEVLEEFYNEGASLGIVTTKIRETSMKGLKLFGLDKYMSTIITYEDTSLHKPNPEPILLAMKKLNANPETTLMVGDTQFDIRAAQKAGITSIGVSWSIKGKDFIEQLNPDYVIDDMRDLRSIVRGK